MKNMIKDALVLFAITLIAGAALGLVYEVTKEPIAKQQVKAKQEACAEVFESAATFEDVSAEPINDLDKLLGDAIYAQVTIEEVLLAKDASNNDLGYVLTVTSHEGYAGDISFMMGITKEHMLNGIAILSISETAGLGMQAEDVLKPQFANKTVEQFEYTKTGAMTDNQIDAISGATITTSAFTNAVNAGLKYSAELLKGESGNE